MEGGDFGGGLLVDLETLQTVEVPMGVLRPSVFEGAVQFFTPTGQQVYWMPGVNTEETAISAAARRVIVDQRFVVVARDDGGTVKVEVQDLATGDVAEHVAGTRGELEPLAEPFVFGGDVFYGRTLIPLDGSAPRRRKGGRTQSRSFTMKVEILEEAVALARCSQRSCPSRR